MKHPRMKFRGWLRYWLPGDRPRYSRWDKVCSGVSYRVCRDELKREAWERGVASTASLVVLPLHLEPVGVGRAKP